MGIAEIITDPRKLAVVALPPGLKQGVADVMELYYRLYPYTAADYVLKKDFIAWAAAFQTAINAALTTLDQKVAALAVSVPRPYVPGFPAVAVPPFGVGLASIYPTSIYVAPPIDPSTLSTLIDAAADPAGTLMQAAALPIARRLPFTGLEPELAPMAGSIALSIKGVTQPFDVEAITNPASGIL